MDPEKPNALSDLELLDMEMDLLWGSEAGPEFVLACAGGGVRTRIGKHVPAEVARTLAAEVANGALAGEDSGVPPPQLERWRVLLEDALGAAVRLAQGSGPSYLIEPGVSFRRTAELVRSETADSESLRAANPGNWGADEWQDLIDGHLGPWVMARLGERVISICHTPASNPNAAEAGVWTHPDFRGQGSRRGRNRGMGRIDAANWEIAVLQHLAHESRLPTRCGAPWPPPDRIPLATTIHTDWRRLDRSACTCSVVHD